MTSKVRIEAAVLNDELRTTNLQVHFTLDETVDGLVWITDARDRVYVETRVGDALVEQYKLDPNEANDDFAVLLAEIKQIEPFAMPVTTDDPEAVAAVVAAYVTNGRRAWS